MLFRSRVYVEEPVYDEFVAKVSDKVRALRVGKPEGYGSVEVGAITFPPQLDTIKDHVADAVQKGARVITGGQELPGAGSRLAQREPEQALQLGNRLLGAGVMHGGHAQPLGRLEVEGQVVDVHAQLRRDAGALGA